jgi:chromosome segregation ATPase
MIDIHIPTLHEYDTTIARQLAINIKELRNFDDIVQWDQQAIAEIDSLRNCLKTIEDKQQSTILALEKAKRDHQDKPFLTRLFSSRQEEKRLIAEQSRLANEKLQLEQLIDQFEAAIDFTPNSPEDLKELIKECKLRKKELQVEKKAISTQMTSIRVEARQRTARVISGKYGTWDRRQIRLNKEAALQPHENEKAAIDRQIVKLDRIIAWLERFR